MDKYALCDFTKPLREHYVKNGGKGDLVKLLKEAGATSKEAKLIAETTQKRLKRLSQDGSTDIIAKLVKEPGIKADSKKFKRLVAEVVDNRGRAEYFDNAINEAYGIPGVSKARQKKIQALATEIQNMKRNRGTSENAMVEKTLELQREIEESVPSEFFEKLDTYTTFNLLSGPSTSVVNVSSNALRLIGQIANQAIRGKLKYQDIGLLKEVGASRGKQVYSDIAKGIRRNYGLQSDIYGARNRRTFRPEEAEGYARYFEKAGEGMEKFLRATLEGPDVVVRNIAYTSSILDNMRSIKGAKIPQVKNEAQLKRLFELGVEGKIPGISKEKFEEINYIAENEALETVFQDDNFLSKLTTKIGNSAEGLKDSPYASGLYPPVKFLMGTAMKFKRTPANVAMAVLKNDILGAPALSAIKVKELMNKGVDNDLIKKEVLKGITNMLVGQVGLGGAGYILERAGFFQPEGYGDSYVLTLGGNKYNVGNLFAMFMPSLTYGANLSNRLRDENEEGVKDLIGAYGDTWGSVSKTLLEMPLMSGIKQSYEAAEGLLGGNLRNKKEWVKMLSSGGMQMVPMVSFLRKFAKGIDPLERDTYSSDAVTKAWNQFKVSIPGLRQTLPEKIDTAGRPVKPVTENMAVRFVDAMFNPVYGSRRTVNDPVFAELKRLKYADERKKDKFDYAPSSISGKNKQRITLSDAEKRQYTVRFGKYVYPKIQQLMKNPRYKSLSDEKKQEIIRKVELKGKKLAKKGVSRT